MNPAGRDGVFFGGGWGLFGEQVLAVAVVDGRSRSSCRCVIGVVLEGRAPGRASASTREDEEHGLDLTLHSEAGYSFTER